jgi:serine phosphatase RsbU (regulator of sigma subunit)
LQRSLLPPHLPEVRGLDLASRYHAGGEGLRVGGDFFDVFADDPSTWVFVIGDVCGKGAGAAAVTALARYTIRAAAMHEMRPAGITRVLNDALRRAEEGTPFLTAIVAVVNLGDQPKVTLCCAGHPAPMLRSLDGSVREVGAPGDLLGVFDDVELTETDLELEPGDVLLLYTDGVTEARDEAGRELGSDALAWLLAGTRGSDAEHTVGAVVDAVLGHRGPNSRDDVALLAVGRRPYA